MAYQRGVDLWLFEFARGGVPTKFTYGNYAVSPFWSADGSRIAFGSLRGNGSGVYQKASNLTGQEELLYQSPEFKVVPNWTRDGMFLMYTAYSWDGKAGDLWILPSGGSAADRKPLSFLRTEFDEYGGRFSPDGRSVAYTSNQSGKYEITCCRSTLRTPDLPPLAVCTRCRKTAEADVRWSRDGKELIYLATDGSLMSVEVIVAGSAFQTGTAQSPFKPATTGSVAWDVSADGQRFLIAAPATSGAAPVSLPFHVVVNWTGLLKR